MNRIDRLTGMIQLLQGRRVITAQEMADHFEISLRTVYRDIAALGEAGVPIVAEAGVEYSLARVELHQARRLVWPGRAAEGCIPKLALSAPWRIQLGNRPSLRPGRVPQRLPHSSPSDRLGFFGVTPSAALSS